MGSGLHIAGHADDRIVDLVIAEPKGRVIGLYCGANGEIAITTAEARFLLEALPLMIARAEYLDHMGPLPELDPSEEPEAAAQDIKVDSAADRVGRRPQGEASAGATQVAATNSAQPKGQREASPARPEPTLPPQSRGRSGQRHRSGRARAGQAWHGSEDTALISGYRAGQGIKDLARIHGRSTKAIELRLERLGVNGAKTELAVVLEPTG